MTVTGGTTTRGIPKFADGDSPDLAAGGLGGILDTLDGLIGAYKIADTTLGASAASIDIAGIPQTFAHLRIVWQLRGDSAGSTNTLGLRFNGDTGANYDFQYMQANAGSQLNAEAFAQTIINAGSATASAAAANEFGFGEILIPGYASTTRSKRANTQFGYKLGTTTGLLLTGTSSGFWRNTAGITRVTLLPASGGNWIADSRVSLYGIG